MADLTVDGLSELSSPAANDEIGIWDVSAGQYLKIQRSTLVGGTITGAGTIATGGFTLTVPATGTAALKDVNSVFTADQTIGQVTVKAGSTGICINKVSALTVASAGVQSLGEQIFGIVLVIDGSDGEAGLFLAGSATALISGGGSLFSATKDTASKINVYQEAGVTKVQNNLAASKGLRIWAVTI